MSLYYPLVEDELYVHFILIIRAFRYFLYLSHLDRPAAVAHLSEADHLADDKAVDRYNVSRTCRMIFEKDMTEAFEKVSLLPPFQDTRRLPL